MSIETTLKSLITPLVSGGCHNGADLDEEIATPYVVFHEIAGVPVNTITEYAGLTRCRYQVDVFAPTPEHAKGLALGTIKDAIAGSEVLQGSLIFQGKGQYSEEDKTFQYITEYIVWSA